MFRSAFLSQRFAIPRLSVFNRTVAVQGSCFSSGTHDPTLYQLNQLKDLLIKKNEESKSQGKPFTVEDAMKVALSDPEVRPITDKLRTVFNKHYKARYGFNPSEPLKEPIRVAITGGAGAISYSLIFQIATGSVFGPDQPVIIQLLELPGAMKALGGVVMELNDCAFPLVHGVVATDQPNEAFKAVSYAFLVGAKPRSKGMERSDLLKSNAEIFVVQGKALDEAADRERLKVLVVGNPANTNALIAAANAPNIDPRRFTAMTRLDHNRGLAQLAAKTGTLVTDISRFAIWGNHSSTQYPDISHTKIKGEWARKVLGEDVDKWLVNYFIPTVQQRGAAIIAARGASSAASAALAACDHMRDWHNPVGSNGEWVSKAILSEGQYGTAAGIYYSYPVICENGQFSVVENLPIDSFSAERMQITQKELLEERDAVTPYMPKKI